MAIRSTLCAFLVMPTLLAGCAAINRAYEERTDEWVQSGITVDEARKILGTAPYAVPDLEIVAIHFDKPSDVVMVEQRLKSGILIGLSQHRGHERVSRPREFLAFERLHVERVAYSAGAPSPTSRYVRPSNTMGLPTYLANRWFTRYTDDLTIRIWSDAMTPEELANLLQTAEPIGDARQ